MNSPDDPELRMAPNEKPRPRLLSTAASVPLAPPEPAPPRRRSVFVTLWLVFIAAAVAGAIAAGADYFFRHENSTNRPPISVLKPIRQQPLPTPPSPPLDVPASALHVTTIVLGATPLAIVNGKQLSEGDWLELRMDAGVAALHVVKIEDGVVRFAYAGRVIDARFDQTAQKKSP